MGTTATRVTRGNGDWIYTASGKKFWPLDPRPEEIDIGDIAEHLSGVCRFNGACKPKYSVAEHSVRVARAVEVRVRGRGLGPKRVRTNVLSALLHDGSEAYICDLTRPMKGSRALSRVYKGFEAGLQAAIWEKFGLPEGVPPDVHWADMILLATEFRDLMQNCAMPECLARISPLPDPIWPLSSEEARVWFLRAYEEIESGKEISPWRVAPWE
jgi:hypothetical protein